MSIALKIKCGTCSANINGSSASACCLRSQRGLEFLQPSDGGLVRTHGPCLPCQLQSHPNPHAFNRRRVCLVAVPYTILENLLRSQRFTCPKCRQIQLLGLPPNVLHQLTSQLRSWESFNRMQASGSVRSPPFQAWRFCACQCIRGRVTLPCLIPPMPFLETQKVTSTPKQKLPDSVAREGVGESKVADSRPKETPEQQKQQRLPYGSSIKHTDNDVRTIFC